MKTEPEKFCKTPFRSLVVDNDGTLLPCCEFIRDESALSSALTFNLKLPDIHVTREPVCSPPKSI